MKRIISNIAALGLGTIPAIGAWGASTAPAYLTQHHPLDALDASELAETVKVLKAASLIDDTTWLPTLKVLEPSKDVVLAWRPEVIVPRRATVTVARGSKLFEAIVNLSSMQIENWNEVHGKHPRLIDAFDVNNVVRKDPRFLAALKTRGIADASNVICLGLPPGPIDNPKYSDRRVVYAPCFLKTGKENMWVSNPIEGLMPIYDVILRQVLDIVDLGAVAAPIKPVSLHPQFIKSDRAPIMPVRIIYPEGQNIKLHGTMVEWGKWSFHFKLEAREGAVMSLLSYNDLGTKRPIIYQMAPVEMFVPYMDIDKTWSWRAYMDLGEAGFGIGSTPLQPGIDCPTSAHFIDAIVPDEKGIAAPRPSAICVFEQPTGDAAWRHGMESEGRANVQLIVRTAPNIGNYDYFVDYILSSTGTVDVRIGATGIDAVKGVTAATVEEALRTGDLKFGTLIATGLVGVNHDHYVSMRVDMDVDGAANRAVFARFMPKLTETGIFRRSLWEVASETIEHAGPIMQPSGAGNLLIESATRKNALGYPTAYLLEPGHAATSLLSPDDPIQVRASWARYSSWLSVFDPNQRYPSGDYPNLDSSGDGLEKWTKSRQSLLNNDLVLWYTFGFRHVPRSEDYPVMPTIWHSFRLRPTNFFDQNPALDLPTSLKP